MRDMTITWRMRVSMLAVLLLMLAGSLYALYTLYQLPGRFADIREQAEAVRDATGALRFHVSQQRAALFSAVADSATGTEAKGSVAAYSVAQRAAQSDLATLSRLNMNSSTRAELATVSDLLRQFNTTADTVTGLVEQDRARQAVAANSDATENLVDKLESSIGVFSTAAITDSESSQDATDSSVRTEMLIAAIVLIAGLVAGLIVIGLVPQGITHRLHEVTTRMGTSATEMLAVATQVSASTVQTATSVSEAVATVEEVRQTSLLASQKAAAVADSAREAEQVAESGREAVTETLDGIGRIQEQMSIVADSIGRLSEQTEAVGEIISTSNDIAEQSNLLSVNAAIEAAKATDAGKGFTVVAEEIKNLAQQSKQGVMQVRGILNDIQKATATAVMAAEQSAKAIDEGATQSRESSAAIEKLAESVAASAQLAMQIAASAQQELAGMDQISQAMSDIDHASAQNATGATQMATETERLQAMAKVLGEMIDSKWASAATEEAETEAEPEPAATT